MWADPQARRRTDVVAILESSDYEMGLPTRGHQRLCQDHEDVHETLTRAHLVKLRQHGWCLDASANAHRTSCAKRSSRESASEHDVVIGARELDKIERFQPLPGRCKSGSQQNTGTNPRCKFVTTASSTEAHGNVIADKWQQKTFLITVTTTVSSTEDCKSCTEASVPYDHDAEKETDRPVLSSASTTAHVSASVFGCETFRM